MFDEGPRPGHRARAVVVCLVTLVMSACQLIGNIDDITLAPGDAGARDGLGGPCGQPGQACCPGSAFQACRNGCCDDGNQTCVAESARCSNGSTCGFQGCGAGGDGGDNCGQQGQPCCAGNSCSGGNVCFGFRCQAGTDSGGGNCGQQGQPCCSGNNCNSGNTCVGSTCHPIVDSGGGADSGGATDSAGGGDSGGNCGQPGQACCSGNMCMFGCCDSNKCYANDNQCAAPETLCKFGACEACGGSGEACCAANACDDGGACQFPAGKCP